MILYFGNILSATGNNPSFIEILGPQLATMTNVKLASDKKNKIFRMMHMAAVFFRFRRRAQFILVDTYSYQGFYYALMISFLSKQSGKKYIPIIRGGNFKRRFSIRPGLTRYLLDSAFAIVVPSRYLQEVLSEQGYATVYIPNFINKGDYPFMKRSQLKPSLLWVRSFHKIYNPALALHVVHELLKTFPDSELCMVGPDKDDTGNECRKLVRDLGIENRVVFTGKLSKPDWTRLAQSYDIFINTTTVDNHPVSVIEAMLLGLPVVSSNVGGIPYLLKQGEEGLVVESDNTSAFVDAIRRLLESKVLAEQIQRAARAKAESFDWPVVKNEWTKLLSLRE